MYTHRHDISQPYHKVIDLLFKLVSLSFGISGLYLLFSAASCYFSHIGLQPSPFCESIIGQLQPDSSVSFEQLIFQNLLMRWLWGAGNMSVAIFISLILVVRHLNETLPDHIYLRCFASEEEKKKRLPLKEFAP